MTSDLVARIAVIIAAFAVALLGAVVMLQAPVVTDLDGRGTYLGARIVPPGPAPNGLPVLGVREGAGGTLEAKPQELAWYRYCGREDAPGLRSEYRGPDVLVYDQNPEKIRVAEMQGIHLWWKGKLGQPVRAEDFPEVWAGAPARWRSDEHAPISHTIPVIVIRVDPSAYATDIRESVARDGFLAFTAYDTHFCCVAGWQEHSNPHSRSREDGFPYIFDSCHDDRYDVRDLRRYDLPPGMPSVPR